MRFKPEDFGVMTYNPFANKGRSRIWEYFPELKIKSIVQPEFLPKDIAYYEDWHNTQIEKLIKFVIIFVDPQSPLIKIEKDYSKRKELAYEALSISKSDRVRMEIENDTPYYNQVITTYFFLVNNYDYEEWFSLRMAYADSLAIIRMPLDGEDISKAILDKQKITKDLDSIKKPMLELEARLFRDDRLMKKILAGKTDEFAGWAEKHSQVQPYQIAELN